MNPIEYKALQTENAILRTQLLDAQEQAKRDSETIARQAKESAEFRDEAIEQAQYEFGVWKAKRAKMFATMSGAQQALRKALPFCPANSEALFVGEWLDEISEMLDTL